MENEIPTPKLFPPSVVFKESDALNADVKKEISSEASYSTQQSKSGSKRPSCLRKRVNPQEAYHMPFKVYAPSTQPVVLSEVLNEVSKVIRTFVIVDQLQADAAALWVFHTYIIELFDTSPILIINAPERACAKTLFQTVLAKVSARALLASNSTASPLFRSVKLWMPSVFFDEADTFFKDNDELIGMVNAGYNSSGFVLRTEKIDESYIPTKFPVYCAKSIAGIALEKHLPDSTMSRGIVLHMRRKLANETVTRLRYAEPGLFAKLCAKLERAADDNAEAIKNIRPVLPEALSDRAQDSWESLLAIAEVAGRDWLDRATTAALILSRQSTEKVSTGNELLADIQMLFDKKMDGTQYADKYSTAELIADLVKVDESPWATYNHGHPLSPRQLASQLATYGIKSKTVRLSPYDTPKGYERSQFDDAFKRYLDTKDVTSIDEIHSASEPLQQDDISTNNLNNNDSGLY